MNPSVWLATHVYKELLVLKCCELKHQAWDAPLPPERQQNEAMGN